MRHFDPELGKPLPEKDYGGNCLLYDPDKPEDPFHNFWVNEIICCLLFYLRLMLFYAILEVSKISCFNHDHFVRVIFVDVILKD